MHRPDTLNTSNLSMLDGVASTYSDSAHVLFVGTNRYSATLAEQGRLMLEQSSSPFEPIASSSLTASYVLGEADDTGPCRTWPVRTLFQGAVRWHRETEYAGAAASAFPLVVKDLEAGGRVDIKHQPTHNNQVLARTGSALAVLTSTAWGISYCNEGRLLGSNESESLRAPNNRQLTPDKQLSLLVSHVSAYVLVLNALARIYGAATTAQLVVTPQGPSYQ